jgi:hypothetical protein
MSPVCFVTYESGCAIFKSLPFIEVPRAPKILQRDRPVILAERHSNSLQAPYAPQGGLPSPKKS